MRGLATATAVGGLVGPGAALAGDDGGQKIGWLPKGLQAPPWINGNSGNEDYWKKVRKAFTLDKNYIHMNTGTTGSLPAFALANLGTYNLYKAQDPKDWEANLNADYPDLFPLGASQFGPSALAARQQQVAAAYNAKDASEIVLS
jgi:hypothetical protein